MARMAATRSIKSAVRTINNLQWSCYRKTGIWPSFRFS